MCLHRCLLIFFSAIVLTNCVLGPDFQSPETRVPERYRISPQQGEDYGNLQWWDVYANPELQNLIRTALENNQDVGLAFARIEEAAALLGVARADYFPEVGVQGSLGRIEFEDRDRRPEEREQYRFSAPLFWEPDIFGKFQRANEAARAEMISKEYFYRATVLTLVANVASTYFQLLDFDNQLRISRETAESRKRSTKIIQDRFEQGYVGQIDLLQAQIQEEIAVASVYARERSVRQTENALRVLLGGAPSDFVRTMTLHQHPELPSVAPGIPSTLLERRPDILASREALHAETARIGVTEALRFPSLSLTGALGVESRDLSEFNGSQDRFWSFSTDVLGPLLSANRNIRRVEAQEARAKQFAYAYYQTVVQSLREVEDALVAMETFQKEHASRRRQVEAGRVASRLSRARYDGGETNYLEVLDNERSLFNAELEESEALRRRYVATIDLYRALGGGWEAEPKR